MKVLKYTGIVFAILFFLLCIVPVGLVQIPAVQRKIASKTASYIQKKVDSRVEIGKIEFRSINKVAFSGVYIEDQQGDTLLTADRITAGLDLLPLLRKQYRFSSAQLFSFDLRLRKANADDPLNIQYIIDAFKPEEKKKKDPVEIRIKTLHLHSGRVSYDVADQKILTDRFDANHIALSELAGKFRFNKLKNEHIDLAVKNLRFREKSGLALSKLSLNVEATPEQAAVGRLEIELPNSRIVLKNFEASYAGYDNIIAEDTELNGEIQFSKLDFADLDALLPGLYVVGSRIEMEGVVDGTLNSLNISEISFSENYGSFLRGDVYARNLMSHKDNIYINIEVKNSLFRANYLKALSIAEELERMGDVSFKGALVGYLNDLLAVGELNSDIGRITADFRFGRQRENFMKGHIASTGFQLDKLLANPDLGKVVFDFNLDSKWKEKNYSAELTANIPLLEYQGYAYDGFHVNGLLANNQYEGLVSMDGEKGKLTAQGTVALHDADSEFQMLISADNLQLNELRFAEKYGDPLLSFLGNFNFKGNDLDNIDGYIKLSDFALSAGGESFKMDSLAVDITRNPVADNIVIRSDIIEAEMEGNYSTQTMVSQLERTLAHYLPSLITMTDPPANEEDNIFDFHALIHDTQGLLPMLKLPVRLSPNTVISGFFDNVGQRLHAEAFMPHFDVANMKIDSCFVVFETRNDMLLLNLVGTHLQDGAHLDIMADFSAGDDKIHSSLNWKSSKQERFEGLLDMQAYLMQDEGLRGDIQLNETEMVFNDSVWTLSPTLIRIDKNRIEVNDLNAAHKAQFLHIDGVISDDPLDRLTLQLDAVDLEYIFKTLDIPALEFGGRATGVVTANDLYDSRRLNAQLAVSDFTFNNTLFGAMNLSGVWMDEAQGVHLISHIAKDDSTFINVDGMIYPGREWLTINFEPQNADLAFLRKYVGNVVKDLSGRASGRVHLVGEMNNPTVEGEVDVKDVRFGIEFLNTWYTFDNHVHMTRDRIQLDNLALHDDFGNTAGVDAWITHNRFADFGFRADFRFDNFFVFNATEQTNPAFYGSVFGTGTGAISGTEYDVNIIVNMQNTNNTALTFNFVDKQDIEEYDFITFVDKNPAALKARPDTPDKAKKGRRRDREKKDRDTNMRVNLMMNINPNAQIEAVMDPVSGDKISGQGNGHMEVIYATNEPLKLLGTYIIESGKYDFSLEQLYFRKFVIHEGSSITFRGNPMEAMLDVKATSTVHASLGDLDPQLRNYSARGKAPVDCVINVSGELERPDISFNIELPDAPPEVERQVKRYMRTEDMLNRQVLYLLVLNRFYTSPEFSTSSSRVNNDLSLLTSTLSNQLSNILGSFSEKIQIGTQFYQSYEGDLAHTEIELALSSMLFDNRLILYGNIGYIDNPYISNASGSNVPLVGDFDVEYKLTPGGDIRLKGFNHYNYRNYFSIAPEWTQGIGILFRKDFDNILDLFKKKKKEEKEPAGE